MIERINQIEAAGRYNLAIEIGCSIAFAALCLAFFI